MNEPLVQTQVIPYLRELAAGGNELTLLTFEPGEVDEQTVRESLSADGIEWHWLRYHKRPSVPATLFDVANGVRFIRGLMKEREFDILHARSHVPMMMAALARKSSRHKPNILFDIRGFMPEEFVDGGLWPEGGWIYRSVKRAEKWLMKEADGFVVLTERASEILSDEIGPRPVEVIPCCVDLKRFELANGESRQEIRARLGLSGRKVVTYVGSFGGWYLSDELVDFFSCLYSSDPSIFPMVLTQRNPSAVEEKLRASGLPEDAFLVESLEPRDLADYLIAADVAVSFIKPCFSKLSSSPTKLAEYLACGLPIISNRGIGDVDQLLQSRGVGVLINSFECDEYQRAFQMVGSLGDIRQKCRAVAALEFDLATVGHTGYNRIYGALSGR